jgi:hypothetical protein
MDFVMTGVKAKRINSSREVAPGNAVVSRARWWRSQVNGRKNNNKSKQLGAGPALENKAF